MNKKSYIFIKDKRKRDSTTIVILSFECVKIMRNETFFFRLMIQCIFISHGKDFAFQIGRCELFRPGLGWWSVITEGSKVERTD